MLAAAGKASPSINRAQAAIAHIHTQAGYLPPHRAEGGMVIAEALAGVRRSRTTPPDRKAPADAEFLLVLLDSITSNGLAARRDWALLIALEMRDSTGTTKTYV